MSPIRQALTTKPVWILASLHHHVTPECRTESAPHKHPHILIHTITFYNLEESHKCNNTGAAPLLPSHKEIRIKDGRTYERLDVKEWRWEAEVWSRIMILELARVISTHSFTVILTNLPPKIKLSKCVYTRPAMPLMDTSFTLLDLYIYIFSQTFLCFTSTVSRGFT